MHIRFATPADATAIGAIHAQSWKAAYKGIVPQRYLDALNEEGNAWEVASQKWMQSYSLAAQLVCDGEKPVGCVGYGCSRDKDLPLYGEVFTIYLLPEYIGQGYGRALLSSAAQDFSRLGYLDILLWVFEDNMRARHFYERNGFVQDEAKKSVDYMGKKLTEVRYVLHLPNPAELKKRK